MLAMTRGPSTKPACAAMKSNPVSEINVSAMNQSPALKFPICHAPATFCASVEFIVMLGSGSGIVCVSRYARQMPPAVIDSDVAIKIIVRFAVRTRGSRMICIPFETASIPVYVPPPSEYARTKSASAPIVPRTPSVEW
jgi:hypothetical protein